MEKTKTPVKQNKIVEFIGIGRRKCSVASLRLRPGKGKIDINHQEFDKYFPSEIQRQGILEPFRLLNLENQYDLIIRLKGGGKEAQATAVRLAIARAVVKEDEERRQVLKEVGFLTRDPRRKERKKYGLRGARKAFQFSKR